MQVPKWPRAYLPIVRLTQPISFGWDSLNIEWIPKLITVWYMLVKFPNISCVIHLYRLSSTTSSFPSVTWTTYCTGNHKLYGPNKKLLPPRWMLEHPTKRSTLLIIIYPRPWTPIRTPTSNDYQRLSRKKKPKLLSSALSSQLDGVPQQE